MDENKDPYIATDQLEIGMYIHLDLGWLDHPFSLPSFKIRTEDQIDIIKKMKLDRVRYDPKQSDAPPRIQPPTEKTLQQQAKLDQDYQAFLTAKRQRVKRLNQQREALDSCEKKFQSAASAVKSFTSNLFSRTEECLQAATDLVGQLAESIMVDRDIAMHLMGTKKIGEEQYFHSLNVAVLAMMLGKEMKLDHESVTQLGMGGLFHDIGKMDLPDKILLKTEVLTRAEKDLYEQHCAYGVKLGQKIGLSTPVLLMAAQHHEHMDGSGYPRRLLGDKIHPLARVLTVVNTYDNLCNHVMPSRSLTPHEALSIMYASRRAQFDPQALNQFIRVMGIYPPGTVVSLNNGMLGLVVSINIGKPLKPCVMIYDPKVEAGKAPILDLDQETELTISKSLRPAQLTREAHDYLGPRRNTSYFFDASSRGTTPNAGESH